jgi:hypothetical protein
MSDGVEVEEEIFLETPEHSSPHEHVFGGMKER